MPDGIAHFGGEGTAQLRSAPGFRSQHVSPDWELPAGHAPLEAIGLQK